MSEAATRRASLTLSEHKGSVWKEYELGGRTYFVNVLTGQKQWTRPNIDDKIVPNFFASASAPVPQDLIDASNTFETIEYHRMERHVRESDITLAFHGDVTRVHQLKYIARSWQGPISASILLLESEIPQVDHALKYSPELKEHVDINLCVTKKRWSYYPGNKLRNVANQHSRTDYVFIMDGDEDSVQSMDVYKDDLHVAIASSNDDLNKTAFIVTSWQWSNRTQPASEYPRTKADIARLSEAGKVVCKAADFPQAYSPLGIGLDEWMGEETTKRVPWHDRYEPYMVVHRKTVGTFDERFVGWGGNKAIKVLEMQLQHTRFLLLPHVFTFTNESIVEDNAAEHSLPADPDLPERAAEELGVEFGCTSCTYKECVMNCLGDVKVHD